MDDKQSPIATTTPTLSIALLYPLPTYNWIHFSISSFFQRSTLTDPLLQLIFLLVSFSTLTHAFYFSTLPLIYTLSTFPLFHSFTPFPHFHSPTCLHPFHISTLPLLYTLSTFSLYHSYTPFPLVHPFDSFTLSTLPSFPLFHVRRRPIDRTAIVRFLAVTHRLYSH